MHKALQYFLQFQNPTILDQTEYGEVIERVPDHPAYIYINGVRVATEENFLFSYNITHLNKAISKALNRERTNVGRTAYTSTIQKILMSSENEQVISLMSEDLQQFAKGTVHDELKWMEVQMHTTRQLNKNKDVVFVTAEEIHKHTDLVNDVTTAAKMVIVPENLAAKMQSANKIAPPTETIRTFSHMVSERDSNFTSSYIPLEELTEQEKRVYEDGIKVFQMLGNCHRVEGIRISEKMQRDTTTFMECVGLWSPSEKYITIHRRQLQDRESFLGTLLHELSHAVSGASDATRDFEKQLTKYLGILANKLLG